MTIRSNPPGALVYVDNYEIGTTPCSTAFTYYGTRQIRLVKDGYETLTVDQPINAPSYQIPPLDFVSETMTPTETRDERTFTFNLHPQIVVPANLLKERAEQLRHDAQTPDAALAIGFSNAAGVTSVIPGAGPPMTGPLSAAPIPPRPYNTLPAPLIPRTPPGGAPGSGAPGAETLPPGGQAPIFALPR